MLTGLWGVGAMQAQTVFLTDGDMNDTQTGGGLWQTQSAVTYGSGTLSNEHSVGAEGNPGSYLYAYIRGGVTNGGQARTYSGGLLPVSSVEALGTFDFAFDLKVLTATPTATLKVKPVIFYNANSTMTPLLYTGSARSITADSWTTESWTGLSVDDFAQYDEFYSSPVDFATGLSGIFYVGYLAEVHALVPNGYIEWGVDNFSLIQPATTSAVPEPATGALLVGLVMLGAGMGRRRGQRA